MGRRLERSFWIAALCALWLAGRAPTAWAQGAEIDPELAAETTPAGPGAEPRSAGPEDGALEDGASKDGALKDGAVEGGPSDGGAAAASGAAGGPSRPAAPAPDPYELRLDALAERFDAGVVAWRRGEYAVAEARWLDLLDDLDRRPPPVHGRERIVDRHALLHDLGNAAFRLERPLEAVGWYLAALRHAPRDRETRANLALARREAGLEPEPDPDFLGSLVDSLGLVTPAESRWLALLGLVPLLTALLGEAARGGRAWRGLLVLGVLAAAAAAAPLVRHELFAPVDPLLVVQSTRAPYRAEPLEERPPIGALDPGQVVERIDQLPDWVRIETADGERGWLPREAVFPIRR